MSETISETKACDLLTRLFRSRGYTIARNVLFREYGVEFHVDGWDEKNRVGFEFLSSEDEDHIDLSLEEYQTLSDAQRRGELALFIIDEVEPLTSADLVVEASEFLDEVSVAGRARRTRAAKAAAKFAAAAARGGPGKTTAPRAVAPARKPVKKKMVRTTKTSKQRTGKKAVGRAAASTKKAAVKKPSRSKARVKRRVGR